MSRKEKIVIVDTGSDFTARLQQALDHLKIRKTLLVFQTTPEAVSYILQDWKSIFCLISRAEGDDPEGLNKYATSVIHTGSDFIPEQYIKGVAPSLGVEDHEFALIERYPAASEKIFEAVVAFWETSTTPDMQAHISTL